MGVSPFILKLRHGAHLTVADEAVLARLAGSMERTERGDIMPQGAEMRSIVLVLQGWACHYKLLENGKRQITSVFLPGDLCEPFGALPPFTDYSLGALTPVLLTRVAPSSIRDAVAASPRIEEALWWDLLLTDALRREHLVSLGRRSATERLGHFFCEVHLRLEMVGLTENLSCEFPLTQVDLADVFGLSAVHVNRSIQELRGLGLLTLRERRMIIHDARALRELSMFNPTYLPLHGTAGV